MKDMVVAGVVERNARLRGPAPAFVFEGRSLSHRDFAARMGTGEVDWRPLTCLYATSLTPWMSNGHWAECFRDRLENVARPAAIATACNPHSMVQLS